LIRDAGYVPAQRGNAYDLLNVHAGPDAPDLNVEDWSQFRAARLHIEGDEAQDGAVQLPVVEDSTASTEV